MSEAATAPGWYPDPWDPGAVRWFDGGRWTEHIAAPVADRYDEAKGASTAVHAGWAFLGRGVAEAAQFVFMAASFGRFWDDVRQMSDSPDAAPFSGFQFGGFVVLAQLAGLALWAALAFLCIWTFRATRNARGLGLRTTFEPAWTVAGWLIPLASLVMPFMAVRDLFPEGHPGRRAAGCWWGTEIAGAVLGTLAMFVALASSEIGIGVGVLAGLLALAAAVQGRRLTRTVLEVHAELARAQGLA